MAPRTADLFHLRGRFIFYQEAFRRIASMAILGLDTVAIVVVDRHKAIRWYRNVLGLDIAYLGPNDPTANPSAEGAPDNSGHWIELGPKRPRTRVHLCEMPQAEAGPTGITFLTDDIRKEYERMRDQGVRFLYPPKRMDWGEWLTEFVDPDGNQFDLKQPVSTHEWRT
jgi:catechol 2,3-dioxygenase-like lactoylglutathione lyase family enzyme